MSIGIAVAAEPHFPREDRPRRFSGYAGLGVIGVLPLLLLSLSSDWCVTAPGNIDPWVYFGYYQNLPRHLTVFDGTYYGTRLSTILPGYAAYCWFPPLVANYVLHLGLYYASVVSLYLVLARTVSQRAGLLAALCLGCQYFFLQAIGWDYVDGFGIAYFFLSVLALTTAARARFWKSSLVAAGIASAAFVIANVFYVVYLPYFVIHYLFVNRQTRRNPLLLSLGLYCLGAAGLTLALCLYNGWVTGRYWFLGPSLQFARSLAGNTNPWKAPMFAWLPGADWLVLPALTVLGTLFYFYRFRPGFCDHSEKAVSIIRGAAVLYQVQFLFALAMIIGWEWYGQPVLQCSCYASLLLPATLLALGAQLGPHVERLSGRQFGVLVAMVLIILLAPFALKSFGDWLARLYQWSGGLTLALGMLGLGVLATCRTGALSALAIIALFIAIPATIASHTFAARKTLPGTEFFKETTDARREPYQPTDVLCSVVDADKVLQEWDPAAQARFWYHARAPMGKVCTAVCSTYLWGYRLVNVEFPALVDPSAFRRLKGQRVVILSADPDALVKANAAMQELGLKAHLLAEKRIEYPSIAFTMSYIAVVAMAQSEQPLLARFEQGVDKGTLRGTPAGDALPLPLDKWHCCYDSPRMSLAKTEEGLQVTTASDRWAYALLYSPLTVLEEGDYRFDLEYTLQNGDIAFGALTEDQSRWLGQAGPGSTAITSEKPGLLIKSFSLHVKAGETIRLLLTNNHPTGNHPSQLMIHEARAFREASRSQAGGASHALAR